MSKYPHIAAVAFCLAAASCQSQRNVLHHGSAKANYMTPTAGSVMVQTPTMLPTGMARASTNTWPQQAATALPASYASNGNSATAQPAIALEAAAPITPPSNASAVVASETARNTQTTDPFENRPSTPEKYQPAYPSLTEPQKSSKETAPSYTAEPFDAPVAAPSRSGARTEELPLPVSAPNTASNSEAAAFTPPQAPASTGTQRSNTSKTSSSLIEEILPPR
jgi:hypothetical protein